jgi:hypothetical protein
MMERRAVYFGMLLAWLADVVAGEVVTQYYRGFRFL